MTYPKIFDKQPEITEPLLVDLEKRGLINSENSAGVLYNKALVGEVVSYILLAEHLKQKNISTCDAKALLVIEATRKKGKRQGVPGAYGPRDTHFARLIKLINAETKQTILERVEAWAKNH